MTQVLLWGMLGLCSLAGLIGATPTVTPVPVPSVTGNRSARGPTIVLKDLGTNLADYANGHVPLYEMFEVAFDITDTAATNPYLPYDEHSPPGVAPATGITVDARMLAPGETNWNNARTLPCFTYQPVEQVGSGDDIALLPVGKAEWRCRFTPDAVGTWRYKIQATDAGGSAESEEDQFTCVESMAKGFVAVSQTDPRFFEFSDGTPFVMPLVNLEEGNPFNTLADIRENVSQLGQHGIRFVRWFPTGEGVNYDVAPYADSMRINWFFGDGWITADDADVGAGKLFSYAPHYYSTQPVPIVPRSRYRLAFRAKVTGDRVLRPEIGDLGGTIDICSAASTHHESQGETCTYKRAGWNSYLVEVESTGSDVAEHLIGLRGLYVSSDAPAPYNNRQEGSILVHSVELQRDETGHGGWGPNLLTRSDPDTHQYVDQRSAARLDEILRLSEEHGVYHKLTPLHKNDAVLNRFQADGTIGDWYRCTWGRCPKNFYSDDGQASRWYQDAYTRYFVARWSYSPALHSLELANENDLYSQDESDESFKAGWHVAEWVQELSPRHILMSNSFWGWWAVRFWTEPGRGHLMDYSDKHWYADLDGAACDFAGSHCELISNVWMDSAAYVRECWERFNDYSRDHEYSKPIVRGEGGVAESGTEPQHPSIATDAQGIYYHKKLWAHVGVLGYSCDGEWYPRLFVPEEEDRFPNDQQDLLRMFAAYERFVRGEPLSNGPHVEIGTDLAGSEQIAVTNPVGRLRAWGVRDDASHRVLLWIDNAHHTWVNVVDGRTIRPASGTLILPGLRAGKLYTASWWDPYAPDPAGSVIGSQSIIAQPDGTIALSVDGLARDVALKVYELHAHAHTAYLPLVIGR